MKISFHVVGRLKNGPEKELFTRYFERIKQSGKSRGLSDVTLHEYPESRATRPSGRKKQEAQAILNALSGQDVVIALDERGKTLSSVKFSDAITRYQDQGTNNLVFIIGGADGLDETIRERATQLIAFGAMTWPHQLVRILLAEQLYRAYSIMAGHPYHKQ